MSQLKALGLVCKYVSCFFVSSNYWENIKSRFGENKILGNDSSQITIYFYYSINKP